MPQNKNAQFRYRVIDKCLSNTGRLWTMDDLIDEVSGQMEEQFGIYKGISKRSIQYDLNIMRRDPPGGFGAPIVCKDGCYSYSEDDYSIIHSPLIDSDKEQIHEAITILKQFRGLPHFMGLEQILQKLEGQVISYGKPGCIQFEINEEVKGLEWLEKIYNSILNQQVLKIEYRPFQTENAKVETVHPYLLKEYHNRWFLLGFNENFGKVSTYALDRISNLTEIRKRFRPNCINPENYFTDAVGVTVHPEDVKTRIVFRPTPDQAPYIKTKPLHKSQQMLSENEAYAEFMIEVIPNFELEQLFLSFGERVVITGPVDFRNTIISRIKNSLNNYS